MDGCESFEAFEIKLKDFTQDHLRNGYGLRKHAKVFACFFTRQLSWFFKQLNQVLAIWHKLK